jgi:di/tricarboxylate transporter
MNNILYCIAILLLVAWVAGFFSSNTGNVMAIAAVVLSRLADNSSMRTTS